MVTQTPRQVQAYLEGLLGPAEQEGMGATAPLYVAQLRAAVKTALQASNAQDHIRLMDKATTR